MADQGFNKQCLDLQSDSLNTALYDPVGLLDI